MKKLTLSGLHLEVDKTNSTIMTVVAIATVISIFCLVSSKTLLSEFGYQHRLLGARRVTVAQLSANEAAATNLVNQYTTVFENSDPTNIIGGKNNSSANAVPPDGDNASIVLDSLPTEYNFPAVISSVASMLTNNSVSNPNITGTDDSATAINTPSNAPEPMPIKLSVGGQTSYDNLQQLVKDFERSTRPFDITELQLNGSQSLISFEINVTTYYQPAKTLTINNQGKYVR